jgi:hypothetical protein
LPHGLLVLVAVKEKLGLPDDPLGPREAVQQVENIHDLAHGVGRPGLLPIPEGGVREQHLLRGTGHNEFVVEVDTGHFRIGEEVPHQVGLIHLLQPMMPKSGVLMIQ